MSTNFFQQLSELHREGNWKITIKTAAHNRMLVAVLLDSEKVTDAAKKLIPPLLLKGTAEELDSHFFDAIRTPMQKTTQLLLNMDEFEKGLEKARQESKMEQSRKDREKKEKDDKQKQYETTMKKVRELQQAGKFREAFALLPKAEDHKDHAAAIEELKKALSEKFEQPGLF